MTPDIQELKDKALTAADLANHLNGIDPYTILALIEVAEAAQKLVSAVDDLISESHGVYGLHQNGDIAPWDTLTEGGQFEDWLLALSGARAALKKATDV